MTRQETIDKAVNWAVDVARDARYGYDQAKRWGPDYDCSSFVISAWQHAGVPVKTEGAVYTGNMEPVFLKCGFRDVTTLVNLDTGARLEKGDVLLNKRSHAMLYIGGGKCVGARVNELGSAVGGQSGDQNGREICIVGYYNYPWDCVLRYMGGKKDETADGSQREPASASAKGEGIVLPMLRRGDRGQSVRAMQGILIACGCGCGPDGADGDFGPATEAALRRWQGESGLAADGICGDRSWRSLLGVSA